MYLSGLEVVVDRPLYLLEKAAVRIVEFIVHELAIITIDPAREILYQIRYHHIRLRYYGIRLYPDD